MMRFFIVAGLVLTGFISVSVAAEKEILLEEVINEAGLEPVKESAVEIAQQEVILEPAFGSPLENAQAAADTQE